MKKKILIVDDEQEIIQCLSSKLKKGDYETFAVTSGKEGYALLTKEKMDAVITDIAMADMDGFSLVQEIKKLDRLIDLPIIICTAYPSKESTFRQMGIDDYLVKPFPLEGLVETLDRIFTQISHNIKFKKIMVQTDDAAAVQKAVEQMHKSGFRIDLVIVPMKDNLVEQALLAKPDFVIFNALKKCSDPRKVIEVIKSYPELKNVQIFFYMQEEIDHGKEKGQVVDHNMLMKECLEKGATGYMGALTRENFFDLMMEYCRSKSVSV